MRPQHRVSWCHERSKLYARENLRTPCHDLQQALPHMPLIDELDVLPTMEELETALASLPSGKAPGMDGIPGEVWMCINVLLDPLYELLCW
ncbi:hypothetical protein Pmani_006489 [Petrolisthes manimaculis]|uniref:Uncharacterized protein n=1 Tax=Petrolisthes manimaculis TaxID=1843537 RepID=A0AAE1Q9T2_9EUCA|nr:hypothetical protein Pmani_006489 [Petrolisthes manimaculis]